MRGRVIQGFFPGGRVRVPPPPVVQQRPTVPRVGPPAPAFPPRPALIQRHGGNDSFAVDPARLGLATGGGRPLPGAVRSQMEAALGADCSGVRVHVGPQAERIGAIAFTTGTDIYFAPGRFQPETAPGRQLLGHELVHVIQQRQGRVRSLHGAALAVVQDRALEAEADRLGQRAAAGGSSARPKVIPGPPQPRAAAGAASRSGAAIRFAGAVPAAELAMPNGGWATATAHKSQLANGQSHSLFLLPKVVQTCHTSGLRSSWPVASGAGYAPAAAFPHGGSAFGRRGGGRIVQRMESGGSPQQGRRAGGYGTFQEPDDGSEVPNVFTNTLSAVDPSGFMTLLRLLSETSENLETIGGSLGQFGASMQQNYPTAISVSGGGATVLSLGASVWVAYGGLRGIPSLGEAPTRTSAELVGLFANFLSIFGNIFGGLSNLLQVVISVISGQTFDMLSNVGLSFYFVAELNDLTKNFLKLLNRYFSRQNGDLETAQRACGGFLSDADAKRTLGKMFGSILILVGLGLSASWWSASALTLAMMKFSGTLAASIGAIVKLGFQIAEFGWGPTVATPVVQLCVAMSNFISWIRGELYTFFCAPAYPQISLA
jgi:Domain of unknown function (DUF4157)